MKWSCHQFIQWISNLITLQEQALYDFYSFKFVTICFVAQSVVLSWRILPVSWAVCVSLFPHEASCGSPSFPAEGWWHRVQLCPYWYLCLLDPFVGPGGVSSTRGFICSCSQFCLSVLSHVFVHCCEARALQAFPVFSGSDSSQEWGPFSLGTFQRFCVNLVYLSSLCVDELVWGIFLCSLLIYFYLLYLKWSSCW